MDRDDIKYLHAEWSALIASKSETSENYFNLMIGAYSADGRFYHTTRHLVELLKFLHQYPVTQPAAYWAAFYHDYIYIAGNKDNEILSAKIANAQLQDLGVQRQIIDQTCQLIEATTKHQATGIEWMDAFLDADMAILGTNEQTYKIYVANVRKEYKKIPPFLFNSGRRKFLQHCLENKRLFLTDWFFERFEIQARKNLAWELTII